MKINGDITANTVSAENQVNEHFKVFHGAVGGKKILFLGNSITLHERAPQIGWLHNWGMAASKEEHDYVHLVLAFLRAKYGDISYCVCNVGKWEQNYFDDAVVENYSGAWEFGADIVIARLGENVNRLKLDSVDFGEKYAAFLRRFTQKAEKVVVTDLFWEHEGLAAQMKKVSEEGGYEFVSIGDLGYEDCNKALGEFEVYGVSIHPNDRGMKAIAERIIQKL